MPFPPVPCAQLERKKGSFDKVLLKYTSTCEIEFIFGDVNRKIFRKVIPPVMLLKTLEMMLSL